MKYLRNLSHVIIICVTHDKDLIESSDQTISLHPSKNSIIVKSHNTKKLNNEPN